MSQTSIATSLRTRENALDALLDATKHGHLITVRDAYRSLEDLLEHDRRLRARTEAQEAHNRERTAKLARRVEQQAAWQATAGGQLTIGRIARRMHQRHCEEFDSIYEGRIRDEIRKMLDAGELDRVRDDFGNKPRWLYFRNTRLSGPIADLAARLNDERETDRRRAHQGSALGWLGVGVW